MWFVVGAAAIGVVGAVAGAEISSHGAKGAANTQAGAANYATQVQHDEWEQTQRNQQPWLTQGTAAINQLGAAIQPGGALSSTPQFNFDTSKYQFDPNSVDVTKDPGYVFRMQQGVNALTAAGAASGNLGSGNMGVALQNYGQGLASQEYDAAYNRALGLNQLNFTRNYSSELDMYNAAMNGQNTLYNRLAGVAGTGQVAANQLAASGQHMANNVGNIAINQGDNRAAATIASANAWSGAVNNLANQGMGAMRGYNYLNNNQGYTGSDAQTYTDLYGGNVIDGTYY